MPVGEVILDEGIGNACEQLAGSMPTGDRAEHYLDIIRSSWKPGTVWSDAFAAQLSAMCASYGLILVDPRWQGIKEKFVHIMAEELQNPGTSASLLNEEADKFEDSQNRRKALRRPEGSTSLFLEIDGIRHILRTEGKGFLAGTEFFTEAGLLDMLQSEPGRFSPGASLRPVCQDAIFPVAALIGGPGERRYLEQIRPLYEVFGVDGSIVWPRASFTLIDRRVKLTARKEGIPLETLFDDPEKIRAGLASESFPHEITGDFDSLERSMREGFARLAGSISRLDATLVQSVEKDWGKVLHILEGIKKRAVRAHKASSLLSEKRFSSATYFLQPDRGPQERWFGSDAAFMMLGEEGLQELTEIMSPGEERHRLVFIDEES
jgi:uncharacterized protein YllA (UPF0747 family)